LFTKATTIDGRALYCHGYRDGHGKVALGISTKYDGRCPMWDFVPTNPDDLVWFTDTSLPIEERIRKSFSKLAPEASSKQYTTADDWFVSTIGEMSVHALTTSQAKPEWFFQRMFSLTSSTSDDAIAACRGNEAWLQHKESTDIANTL
jgi:hypothetical protein